MTRDEHFLLITHQSHAKAGSCDKSYRKQFESIHFPSEVHSSFVNIAYVDVQSSGKPCEFE